MSAEVKVAILVFPGVEELDFVGFFEALAVANRVADRKHFEMLLVGRERSPVTCSGGMRVIPDAGIEAIGEADLLFVPGGGASLDSGVDRLTNDERTMEAIRRVHKSGKMVWSVCTGALVLGRAGILKGRRAATHHQYMGMLASFGATAIGDRTVTDGTVTTGGGISSSVDVGLELVRASLGEETAAEVGKRMEYPPGRQESH